MFAPFDTAGVIPALLTPFNRKDRVDLEVLEKLVEWLLGVGIKGFFVCGSSGQGLLLNLTERKRLAERVVNIVDGRAAVVVHVGCLATKDSVALAEHAAGIGAAGVASLGPIYYQPGFEATLEHYKAIGLVGLPFIIYQISHLTGATLTSDNAKRLLEILGLAGIKYTATTLDELVEIYNLTDRCLSLYSGDDTCHLQALRKGFHGAIGTSYNPLPGAFLRLRQAFLAGDTDEARKLQSGCDKVIRVLCENGGLSAFQAAMKLVGHDLGPTRRPLVSPNPNQEEILFEQLLQAGFRELADLNEHWRDF